MELCIWSDLSTDLFGFTLHKKLFGASKKEKESRVKFLDTEDVYDLETIKSLRNKVRLFNEPQVKDSGSLLLALGHSELVSYHEIKPDLFALLFKQSLVFVASAKSDYTEDSIKELVLNK